MAFDNIKLEKGLYSTSKGFTAALEEIDPSENYIGTELEGLDAYQRQLKRFDIKVSGKDSDPVAKFFQTTDSAALFPEYVSRAVAQGIHESDPISKLVATTTTIDSMDYRSIESVIDDAQKELSPVEEGAEFPQTTIKTKDHLTKLYKRGRMLVASYEAVKFQKLDLFTITLKQIGLYISTGQIQDFISCVASSDNKFERIDLTGGMSFDNLVEIWKRLYPYNLTTLFVGSKHMTDIIKLNEFKDANSLFTFGSTGNMVTPFGAELVRNPIMDSGNFYALDKNAAVEKVQAGGGVLTEYDKLIDRQLERATISTIAGFSVLNSGAGKIVTIK